MIRIMSMRGCAFGCNFCAISKNCRRINPKKLIDYLKYLIKESEKINNPIKQLFFEDATFTIDQKLNLINQNHWSEKFAKLLKKNKLNISFGIQTRIDCLNEEIIKRLEENLLLFYTGISRDASSVLVEQKENIEKTESFSHLLELNNLRQELKSELHANRLSKFGEILHKGWELKKRLASKITNPALDKYYLECLNNGALGGKIAGAGGGGFLLLYCEMYNDKSLRKCLSALKEMPFKFSSEGSRIIHVDNGHI